jgi:hypothetical protein
MWGLLLPVAAVGSHNELSDSNVVSIKLPAK